jgi:hypothetical protein
VRATHIFISTVLTVVILSLKASVQLGSVAQPWCTVICCAGVH